ncbi:MAG: LamG domain-containing protein, partial [Nitrososphaerota archaeon]
MIFKKILTILLIAILSSTSVLIAYTEKSQPSVQGFVANSEISENLINGYNTNQPQKNTIYISVKSLNNPNRLLVDQSDQYNVFLSETVDTSSNKKPLELLPVGKQFSISVSEKLGVNSFDGDKQGNTIIFAVAKIDERMALLERIFHPERIRFGKIASHLVNLIDFVNVETENIVQRFADESAILVQTYDEYMSSSISALVYPFQKIADDAHTIIPSFETDYDIIDHQLIKKHVAKSSIFLYDVNENLVILVLIIPLVGVIILGRPENIKRSDLNQLISYCFVILILSTAYTGPTSISSTYWQYANAEEPAAEPVAEEPAAEPVEIPTNSTQSEQVELPTNSTQSEQVEPFLDDSVSITDAITVMINNTIVFSSNDLVNYINSSSIFSNSTFPVNATTIQSNSTIIQSNSTIIQSNSTINNTDTSSTEKSWQFDELNPDEIQIIGNATIQNDGLNGTALHLGGYEDYVKIENDNATLNLTQLTIAGWVKPDYSDGSPEFTVIGKSNAFSLSINNIIPTEKIAKFAVFNGIEWTTVESYDKITDGSWTHLAATFNGTEISIYVNGTLQSTQKVDGLPYISVDGQIETKTVNEITSESDIVIGAYLSEIRSGSPKILNKFSGLIDDVHLHEKLLGAEEILESYTIGANELENQTQTAPIENDIEEEPVIDLDEIDVTIDEPINEIPSNSTLENEILVTLTGLEEQLEYIAIEEEQLNLPLDELTVSAWIMPNYTMTGSTEYTVVAKERSFVLSLNNIIPPEKVGVFSVFDGILWSTVIGDTKIPERQWTHLAAIINKKEIYLYLNGKLEGQGSLTQPFMVDPNSVYPSDQQVAGTNSTVMIGVYLDTARGTDSISKRFTGSIDDVVIYKNALTQKEIEDIVFARMPEWIPTNATLIPTNATLIPTIATIANSTLTSYIDLVHDFIELGKPVTWTHEVTLSNNTDVVAIEVPADAEIVEVATIDTNSTEKTIYKSDKNDNTLGKGIHGNKDAKEQNADKIQIIDGIDFDEIKNTTNHKKEKIDEQFATNSTDGSSSTVELESG